MQTRGATTETGQDSELLLHEPVRFSNVGGAGDYPPPI